MTTKTKKLIIIFGISIFVIAIAIGVYFGFQKSRDVINTQQGQNADNTLPVSSNSDNTSNAKTSLPSGSGSGILGIDGKKITRIGSSDVIDFWVSDISTSTEDTSSVFYIDVNGNIHKVSSNNEGDEIIASSPGEFLPVSVISNKDGSISAILFEDGSWKLFYVKDYSWENFDSSVSSVAFSPDGANVSYIESKEDKLDIYTYDLSENSGGITLVLSISGYDMNVSWSDENVLMIYSKPSAYVVGDLWIVNIKKGVVGKVISGKGLMVNFGEYGYGVVSYIDSNDLTSYIMSNEGDVLSENSFSTIPSKCNFYEKDIICAYSNFSGGVIPDEYLIGVVNSNDTIYDINIEDKQSSKYFDGSNFDIDVKSIYKLNDGSIVFGNKYDRGLYKITSDTE